MLSRAKPAIGPGSTTPAKENKKKKQMPKVEDFLNMRDYTGAITLLEVILETKKKYMDSYFSKVKEPFRHNVFHSHKQLSLTRLFLTIQ